MTEFNPDWPHGWKTRGGAKVFLVGKTFDGRFIFENEYGSLLVCLPDGLAVGEWKAGSPADIINAPAPKPEPRKWWVDVFLAEGKIFFGDVRSKKDTERREFYSYPYQHIAIVCITEGDGLEEDK